MASLGGIREKLQRAQAGFCRAADAIGAEDWERQPAPEAWSAGEIVAHLTVVERGIISNADRMLQEMATPVPYSQRLHLPLWLVEARIIRRKSPVAQDTSLLAEKETHGGGASRGAGNEPWPFLRRPKSAICAGTIGGIRFWAC